MEDDPIILKKAHELMQIAYREISKGEYESAMGLMDQAIEILEKANNDTTQFKIQKEMLVLGTSHSKDFSRLISISENGLELYRRRQNPVEQIEILIPLAGLCIHSGEKDRTLQFLDEAEKILSGTTPEIITRYLHEGGLSGKQFLQLRSAEVFRLKEYLCKK